MVGFFLKKNDKHNNVNQSLSDCYVYCFNCTIVGGSLTIFLSHFADNTDVNVLL